MYHSSMHNTLKTLALRNLFVTKHLFREMLRYPTGILPPAFGSAYAVLRDRFLATPAIWPFPMAISSDLRHRHTRSYGQSRVQVVCHSLGRQPGGLFTWNYGIEVPSPILSRVYLPL